MRSPPPTNCAGLQHTLTAEAASVLKHSLLLARRRGHAQLTPLHVAPTLLSLSPSFKRACLTSHPPPPSPSPSSSSHHHLLQCRALELCFNVALNRLPTTPSPFLHSSPQPSLSNALLAALKRAQAHQRRGSLDHHHNQPLLTTVKIHLEHLTISILDDPSVSRVMREAGFSSTAVKNNLEDFSNINNNSPPSSLFHSGNGGVFSSPCSPSASENTSNNHHLLFSSPPKKPPSSLLYPFIAPSSYSKEEDVKAVMDILLLRKKNVVIVGDSVSLTESLVGEIIGRFQRSEVPHELKTAEFIRFHHFRSLKHMKRSEVDMKLMELKRKVVVDGNNDHGGGGIIVYIGDLNWTVVEGEEEEEGGGGYGGVVDHVVSEIGKLFCGETTKKVWLMATATYQTYMKCQMRQPPLEMQWCLQPLLLPSAGLALTLHSSSGVHGSKMSISQNPYHAVVETKLNCCEECASNFEKESQLLRSGQKKTLPLWLQPHSTEAHHKDELSELKRKWNRLCQCLHQTKEEAQNYWSNNGSWNAKSFPYNNNSSSSVCFIPTHSSNLVPRFRRQNSCSTIEFNLSDKRQATTEPVLGSMELLEGKEVIKTTLALGNGGSSSGSGSETVVVGNITDRTLRRAHFCKLLQENLPWHSETVPSIAEALLHSKSAKQSNITLLFLQGNDNIGKTRLALAVKESLFGSQDNNFLHMDMLKKKNKKEASVASHSDMLLQALKSHDQKLVVLLENVDFADAQFRKCISDGFETGKFGNLRIAEENSSSQVVFILTSSGGFTSNNEEKNQDFVMKFMLQVSETKPNNNLEPPIFGHKRRAELDLFSKIKSPRIEEKNEQCNSRKKDLLRNSSFNTLDLNMKADEDDDHESPISSDLTLETAADPLNPNGFLDSIENKFEFITSPAREREKSEMFLAKIKGCFEDACGKQNLVNFSVDERVIQEICNRCGYFTNSLFEKWLKDIFQRSLLERVNYGGGEEKGILFRLCWGGNGKGDHRNLDRNEGFLGSPLPKCVQVNYLMG
ncbi:hypothetical protein PIB30_008203 [Stylosanthes scabra]|uniref:Clp R domain-containing protein n=1 Tax=Stylosanthes scabra TaxID=79078 RepID=A0ABU6Z4J6_9FABA|nr:hypothetical protein [Stylosanthes scabra]